MTDDLLLTGRVALIAGGAGSIGQAVAARLSVFGATVVTADRPGSIADLQTDLRDASAADALVAQVLQLHGRLDILVNCQGITGASVPLWEQTDENWDAVLDICLTSVFRLCRAAIRPMREAQRGAIVSIASVAGKEGNPNLTAYSTAKAGVIGFTKAVGKEVAKEGIRVNCVAPAQIATPMLEQMTPEVVGTLLSKIPMGRPGTIEEVASVVHFLCSDAASFVTAQCYDISGGRCTY
ncbi:SDR family oxidoreductase [Armatimonas rosea]|uniref:3-oxoacyl-[acyl-carrier protein] reductase n=1 Tax=Armatimonas rosea TaxID=685828 RepID=A0A7W9SUB6_ARMRO|nr:SDR family NAD(P)-dependent oxidoreductase [Armatimonas rosea]MBB6052977.1 3-oxoacyl-[acyl-carrier protein] reductase [Armatimonas rosea]